jgi:hypothetical protein
MLETPTTSRYSYTFSEEDAERAAKEWGCNCGPTALAFATRRHIEAVKDAIPCFTEKGYTSPTMMKAGLANLKVKYRAMLCARNADSLLGELDQSLSLVRIQFTGPWTAPGMNPKWAYWHTHWIAAWREVSSMMLSATVFDVNGGIRLLTDWEDKILPALASGQKRDGGYFPTHVWRIIGTSEY